MGDQHVALETVDVNPGDRDLGTSRSDAAELAGVRAGESASRDAVGTVDEDLFDDVLAIRKAARELLEIRPPRFPIEWLGAADLDDHPGRHQRLDCRPVPPIYRRVEALHEFSDRIV